MSNPSSPSSSRGSSGSADGPVSGRAPNASNLNGLDYRAEASRLGAPPVPIIDAHSHINGEKACLIFRDAMDLYGVEKVWSMTMLEEVEAVRDLLDGRLEPIAVPDFRAEDRRNAHGPGYLRRIEVKVRVPSEQAVEEGEILRPAAEVGCDERGVVVVQHPLERGVLVELGSVPVGIGVLGPEPCVGIGDVDHDRHVELAGESHPLTPGLAVEAKDASRREEFETSLEAKAAALRRKLED